MKHGHDLIVKQIVIGSVAQQLTKQKDEATHKWYCYVRPYDLSKDDMPYISSITFELHETFEEAKRVISKPPYEVCEHGWGQFDINITITFADDTSVNFSHFLRLFGDDEREPKKVVVSEVYEELVFYQPSKAMRTLLEQKPVIQKQKAKKKKVPANIATVSCQALIDQHGKNFAELEREQLGAIKKVLQDLDEQIQSFEERLKEEPTE